MKKTLKAMDLVFPAPVLIIGSYDENGNADAMNVAWGGLCSSNPPAYCISIRPQRKTFENIQKTGAFTVAIGTESLMAEADYFGMVSGNKEADKIGKAGLTVTKAEHVNAPVINEFPLSFECKVMQILDIGQHKHVIGEIVGIVADDSILDENDQINASKLKAIAYEPSGNTYLAASHTVGKAFGAGAALLKK